MPNRFSPRPLIAVALAAILTGCGTSALPLSVNTRAAGPFTGLADFPGIDRQIGQLTIARDTVGTRMKAMPSPEKAKPATFFTYKALDNNLGITRAEHINVLERAGSNSGINVVALTDEEGSNNTYAYYVRQDKDPATVTSPYMPIWPGERDTGSPYTLAQAVRWAFNAYPSKVRWLDVNNHGRGAFGIAMDDRSGSSLELPALAAAMEVGTNDNPLDLVSFDACLMSTVEVAYELRDAARYMVASEDVSYALGMNYDKTIKVLERSPNDALGLAKALVLRAERRGQNRAIYSLSALDLRRAATTAKAVDRLALALMAVVPSQKAVIKEAIDKTPRFFLGADAETENHRDLAALTASLRSRVKDTRVAQAADAVKEALFGKDRLVITSLNAPEQKDAAQGVSIHVRADGVVSPVYRRTSFAYDTHWDEFLAALK